MAHLEVGTVILREVNKIELYAKILQREFARSKDFPLKVRREEAHVKGHGEPDGSKMARDGKCKVEPRYILAKK